MKIVTAGLLGLLLVGCKEPSRDTMIREMEMSSGKAVFTQEAVYGECKTGTLEWKTRRGSDRWAMTVICPGVPSQTTTYTSNKHPKTDVVFGGAVETEAEKAAREQTALRKAAWDKLSDAERKALGL